MRALPILLLLVASNTAAARPRPARWSWRTLGAVALVYEDWAQTSHALSHGGTERNPLLGRHPSSVRLTLSCLLAIVPNVWPWRHRKLMNTITTAGEEIVVFRNPGGIRSGP